METSVDGTTWTAAGTVEGKAVAHPTCNISTNGDTKYVRITNTATGTRDLQGVKIATPDNSTGIARITNNKLQTTNGLYDLMGRRVTTLQVGKLYILNGKKMIFR